MTDLGPNAKTHANTQSDSSTTPIDEVAIQHDGVLIVDDNEQNLELLQAYLDELGGDVRVAHDGLQAIDSVDNNPPDIILLDIMMPNMSGFQVCEKLKKDPATRDIPIIMVTALNEVGDVERAIDSGADDFLTKPVNKLELLTRVRSLLRVRQLKRQLEDAVTEIRTMRDQAGD
ncbi:MAG: response regulator [Phycisphaerales bacterium]|nr:response regulator [Phycisphaerales bacterium]